MDENNKDLNDVLLLELIKADDEKAFQVLFERYFTPICRYMYLYVANKQEVEELALDIFTYIWENRTSLVIRNSFKAYLFQAARNKCYNNIRDRKQTCSIEESEFDAAFDVNDLEIKELNNLIEVAVLSLPNRCREVFFNSREQMLSNQEIASRMNVSVKTIEAQITKALKRIRFYLENNYYNLW